MKKIAIFILITILSFSLYFCDKDNPTEDKDNLVELIIPLGTYKYNGYDSSGVKIVTGWIKIIFDDSVNISGEWELDKIGDPQNIGPQVGSGTLHGRYDQNKIYCDLNPGYMDNNLILRGV